MITLYDNPFSPFARKVRMVLHWQQVACRSIDALALSEHRRAEEKFASGRAIVPRSVGASRVEEAP